MSVYDKKIVDHKVKLAEEFVKPLVEIGMNWGYSHESLTLARGILVFRQGIRSTAEESIFVEFSRIEDGSITQSDVLAEIFTRAQTSLRNIV